MKLEVHERLSLLTLLPKQGSYVGLRAIRKAKEIIGFTPEEQEYYELKIVDGKWTWNMGNASKRVLDIPIESYVAGIIEEKLKEMDKKGTITDQYMSLYEKFIIAHMTVEP